MIFVWQFFISLILISCSSTNEFDDSNVQRVLETLSSDEMMGRQTFSPGIEKAASFISEEFKSIGLGRFNKLPSFRQDFKVNSIAIDKAIVIINKSELTKGQYFIRTSGESLTWSSTNIPMITYIKEEDDFQSLARKAFESDKDLLVVVSLKHKDIFSRYRAYFSQPTLRLPHDSNRGANLVFVLSDANNINQLRIDAKVLKEEKGLYNVVGVIKGHSSNQFVLFSAHYDHLGVGNSVEGDSIYNGANDDASGVTAVIELARYYRSKGKPERTLIFAAFTAEEIGGFGSKYFSKHLNPDEIVAMLNIEMIGKASKEGINSAWMSGWDKSDLGKILQNNLKETGFNFFADPYPKQNLFYRSDNATLARLGVPAHSISTTQIDIDKDYHQVSDEVETLDMENITNTIKAIAFGSQGIVDGRQTPLRIKREEVNK